MPMEWTVNDCSVRIMPPFGTQTSMDFDIYGRGAGMNLLQGTKGPEYIDKYI